MNTPSQRPNGNGQERSALLVTNIIKLAGAGIAVAEVFRNEIRPVAMAAAALMIAGGTGLESFAKSFFGK
jgi:hypothetical protein